MTLVASTPQRSKLNEMLIILAPKRQPRLSIFMLPPTVEGENVLSILFVGSARIKRNREAYSAIVWKLPKGTIVAAATEYAMV